jgi:hypothetical protein
MAMTETLSFRYFVYITSPLVFFGSVTPQADAPSTRFGSSVHASGGSWSRKREKMSVSCSDAVCLANPVPGIFVLGWETGRGGKTQKDFFAYRNILRRDRWAGLSVQSVFSRNPRVK